MQPACFYDIDGDLMKPFFVFLLIGSHNMTSSVLTHCPINCESSVMISKVWTCSKLSSDQHNLRVRLFVTCGSVIMIRIITIIIIIINIIIFIETLKTCN